MLHDSFKKLIGAKPQLSYQIIKIKEVIESELSHSSRKKSTLGKITNSPNRWWYPTIPYPYCGIH